MTMPYKRINKNILSRIREIVGPDGVVTDPEKMIDFGHDEFSLRDISRLPEAVVKPQTAEDVSELMRLAQAGRIPVTPRGGGTGLCGGCVPSFGGIVLSLERMNRIREIDQDNLMAVTEAGVTLGDFTRAVEESGLAFPPHPGDESAMIGGLIATNAGGSRAVKYGVIRNYVRGLEAVLADGTIIRPGGKLMKSSTGYSLLHLLIGSEGTLGIITKAVLQLLPQARLTRSLVVPYDDLECAIESVPLLIKRRISPLAVEFIGRDVIEASEEHLDKKWPCSIGAFYLLVILDAQAEEEMDKLSESVAEICLAQGALEIFVADTPSKQDQVLEIRSKIYDSIKAKTVEILDIAVPRAEIARHVRVIQDVQAKHDIWLPTFGHAADGNVHTHIMTMRWAGGHKQPLTETEWREKAERVREELFGDAKLRGGVISGEHGIGLVKKEYLPLSLDPAQIELMKGIKKAFDPGNILNPGKIFD